MGSRLTADGEKMERLMKTLKKKHLFFVDSKTNPKSVAAGEAQMSGVPFAERDVFIDHVETLDFARKALKHTEELALRRGYAIAIGHPKDNTIAALKEWLPTLKAKGIELVPVKALLIQPSIGVATIPDVIPREGGESRLDPPVKPGDDNGGVENVASTPSSSIPDPDLPAPPPEMFPEVTPSADGADESGIQLDPLPEQLPGPLSQIH
jgi:hypothetical protein